MTDTHSNRAAIALLDQIEIPNSNRPEPAVRIGMGAELFFPNGAHLDTRVAAFDLLADYAEQYQDQITYSQVPAIRPKVKPYTPATFRSEGQAAIASFAPDVHCAAAVLGAPFDPMTGGIGHFSATLKSNGPTRLQPVDISHFSWAISGSRALTEGLDAFVANFVQAAGRLGALHGLAGPTVLFERVYTTSSAYARSFPLLARFPGLHCARDAAFIVKLQSNKAPENNRKIFTINWLTALSDVVIDSVPGVRAAIDALPPEIIRHPWPSGVVLQAGPVPQLGDTNRGLVLDAYRHVGQATAPLRFSEYKLGVLTVEHPIDSFEESQKWLARFD